MSSSIRQQPVNREAVRILALEHGLKRASELSGVAYETVKKWSQRQHWNVSVQHSQAIVPAVPVADSVAAELQEHERETRLSLARYSARAAKDSEQLSVRQAPLVHKVAQVAGITHQWSDKREGQSNVMVNVALLGIDPVRMQRVSDNVNDTSTIDVSD